MGDVTTLSEGASWKNGITQFQHLLTARGRTAHYVMTTVRHVREILSVMDMPSEQAAVMAVGSILLKGRSLRTCNAYLRSIKSFSRWCYRSLLTDTDFAKEIPCYKQDRDRRHRRAAFTEIELGQLLATVSRSRRKWRGICGRDRAALYHAAVCTGLRIGTLAVLEAGQFHVGPLDSIASVHVWAEQIKDGEDLIVPIQQDAAAALREYLEDKPPTGRAFLTPSPWDVVRMLRADLIESGIEYCQRAMLDNGSERRTRVLDFHSFRHTFGTRCARAGVPLSTLQRWMGHSTPVLTANIYNQVQLSDAAAALRLMPRIRWG